MRILSLVLLTGLGLVAGCQSSEPRLFRPPAEQFDAVRAAGTAAEVGTPKSCLFRLRPYGVRNYGGHFVVDYAVVARHGYEGRVGMLYKPLEDVAVFDGARNPVAKEKENFDRPEPPHGAMVRYPLVSARVVGRGDLCDLLVAEVPFMGHLPPGRVRIMFDKPSYVLTTDGACVEIAAQSVEVDQSEGTYPQTGRK